MKQFVFHIFCSLLLLGVASPFLSAQTTYALSEEDTEFSVSGTSSLHNWTMNLEKGKSSGSGEFEIDGEAISKVGGLKIQVMTTGLKSGKGQMDDNAYKSLKTEEYPYITFETETIKKLEASDSGYIIETAGNLTIAGNTQSIELMATCEVVEETISCTGTKAVKMTDHDVDPPTAMFGSLKTGDEITINFKAIFIK